MIGFINVNKPQGISSAAVVGKIKHCFKLKKVGHMGTLDPLACGVLPIAIGKATRMFDYFLNKQKTYVVEVEFGYETPSLDKGTDISNTTEIVPDCDEIINGCKTFIGTISQVPPIYSAKNINGEKAYALARMGKEVNLKSVNVEIFDFKCIAKLTDIKYKFTITCSSGTYVRSLIRDLAYRLNSLATVTLLERTVTGVFNIDNSVTLEDLINNNINNYLIPIEKVFSNYDIINVDDKQAFKIKNGVSIEYSCPDNKNVFIKHRDDIIGVATINDNILKLKTFLLEDKE